MLELAAAAMAPAPADPNEQKFTKAWRSEREAVWQKDARNVARATPSRPAVSKGALGERPRRRRPRSQRKTARVAWSRIAERTMKKAAE